MDDKALCYKASLLNIDESTIKVTVEERSESFMSVLTLSDSYFSLTLTAGIYSFVLRSNVKGIVHCIGGYSLHDDSGENIDIRENIFTGDLKVESRYGVIVFPCPDNIGRRILSHLENLSGLFESRG